MSPGMTTGRGGPGGRQGGQPGSRQGAARTAALRPGAAGARSTEPTETDTDRDARRPREKTDGRTATRVVAQERRTARAARRAEPERSGGPGEATG